MVVSSLPQTGPVRWDWWCHDHASSNQAGSNRACAVALRGARARVILSAKFLNFALPQSMDALVPGTFLLSFSSLCIGKVVYIQRFLKNDCCVICIASSFLLQE